MHSECLGSVPGQCLKGSAEPDDVCEREKSRHKFLPTSTHTNEILEYLGTCQLCIFIVSDLNVTLKQQKNMVASLILLNLK